MDLQVIRVYEVDDELGRIVGEVDDAIAMGEVHRERRARPDVVEAQGDHVTLAPEDVLQPGGLLRPPESRQAHPELDEPRAIDEPGGPRDPDPARRRALAERAALPGVGDERRAARKRLGSRALGAGVNRPCRERQSSLPRHLESTRLDGAAELGLGRAGNDLAVHLAGPEEVEVLLAHTAVHGGRHHAEEHGDVDRPGGGPDVRPDEQRSDRELGLGVGRDEDLGRPDAGTRAKQDEQADQDGKRTTIPATMTRATPEQA